MRVTTLVFVDMPVWALCTILFMLTINVLWVIRDTQERLAYNTAYSSQIGDVAFIAIIGMAATVAQRTGLPASATNGQWQAALGLFAVAFGLIWAGIDKPKYWADRYHHMVIAPLYAYLLVNSAAIIFAGASPRGYRPLAIVLFLAWTFLVARDHISGRINQREYLKRRNIHLKD